MSSGNEFFKYRLRMVGGLGRARGQVGRGWVMGGVESGAGKGGGNNPSVRGHNGWRKEHSRHVGTRLLWDCRSVRQRAPVKLRGRDPPRAKQEVEVRFNASSPPTLAPREGEGREEGREKSFRIPAACSSG